MAFENDSPSRLAAAKRWYTWTSTAMVFVLIHTIMYVEWRGVKGPVPGSHELSTWSRELSRE
jgi:hypothetical protein